MNAFLAADGTVANCAFGNNGDENTGLYFPNDDELGMVTGGTERAKVTDDDLEMSVPVRGTGRVLVGADVGGEGREQHRHLLRHR